MSINKITVSISTRNRLESLTRCIQSIMVITDLVHEIIIVDDASDESLEKPLRENLGNEFPIKIRVIREQENKGYIVARNKIVKAAESQFVFNLDDDAFVLEAKGIRDALEIMQQDERVAVVALAQANEDGKAWPDFMQPAPVHYPCLVPSFIGYAHLLRRETFLSFGGYRELFYYMGEEKDYCLRLLNFGYKVLYLPDAKAAHIADPSGRNSAKYLRYTVRNNCLGSLYNEPLLMMTASIPFRLYSYFKMRRGWQVDDAGGFGWIVKELLANLPTVWRERQPVKWETIRRWRQLRREWPRYAVPEAE